MNRRKSKLIRKVAATSALPQTAKRRIKRDWNQTPRPFRASFRKELEAML